jgi:4-aminobutyrate aminotransferase/(S)-3-amino-2-methylpropionate transaminase
LDIIEEEKLNERAELIGKRVINKFNELANRFDCIGNVRGLGAMCAMEIVKDRKSKQPNKELTARIVSEAGKRGLLLLSAGVFSNVIRILMPIVITDEQLEEGLAILEQSVEAAMALQSPVTV